MGDADQFVEVVQPGEVLRIVGVLQLGPVAGAVKNRFDQIAQLVVETATQVVEQRDKPRDGLLSAGVEHRHPTLGGGDQRVCEGGAGVLRVDRHAGLGAIADAPSRGVEDAAEADRVTGVVQHPQVGDDVADLPALVEADSTDHLVGDARTDEHLFQCAGGVVGSVEHRDIVVGDRAVPTSTVDQGVDLPGDEPGLIVLVVGDVTDDQFTVAGVTPQSLLPATGVTRDHRVGRGQDVLGGAVVLLEQDRRRVGEIAFEVLDVADGGAAEGVDGLVGVTHHAQLRRRHVPGGAVPDELADQDVLRMVGVLVFVDQHVAEPPPVVLRDLRVALQHTHRLADEVVEVQRVGGSQPALVLAVDLRDDARQIVGLVVERGECPVRVDQFVLEIGDRSGQQPRRVALDVQAHIAADHQQQPAGVVGVVDREVGVQSGHQ